ncbi:hypothetical protein [Benzoatithermus flavus]|uniref:Uncharacterized protein n=1 Tax=Benzoatithermus flavus TaxID=3108223 RepID=A0ABU8XNX1_9PROT
MTARLSATEPEGRKLGRREAGTLLLGAFAAATVGGRAAPARSFAFAGAVPGKVAAVTPESASSLFAEAMAEIAPEQGFQSRIALGDSIVRLVAEGVVEPAKLLALDEHRRRGAPLPPDDVLSLVRGRTSARAQAGMPGELRAALSWRSPKPIRLTRENVGYYLQLLWPIGLANALESNRDSPLNGDLLFRFASTAGWTLGREENGGAYFNRFRVVELTPEQEALAVRVAQSTYRPCCDNSTFFQDCNHGSALFGLLQLGAAQGLGEDELYREALAFNAFWFPDNYAQTALYFRLFEGRRWADVVPEVVMSYPFSALRPWQDNVHARLARVPNLLPQRRGWANCGL